MRRVRQIRQAHRHHLIALIILLVGPYGFAEGSPSPDPLRRLLAGKEASPTPQSRRDLGPGARHSKKVTGEPVSSTIAVMRGGTSSSSAVGNTSGDHAPPAATPTDRMDRGSAPKVDRDGTPNDIRAVFSDVDGTLVHYPSDVGASADGDEDSGGILRLPPSSTGMRGIISHRTLSLCQDLRRKHGIDLVLISGMRTSTLLNRLPYLPRSDAYCCEAGGRIFYPADLSREEDVETYKGVVIRPVPYDGANEDDLKPFGITEDTDWRDLVSRADGAGRDGYLGLDVEEIGEETAERAATTPIPPSERNSLLWDHARTLMQKKGYVIDGKGYATCFRVNRSKQKPDSIGDREFEALASGTAVEIPRGLSSSVNLGCVDFYPSSSGKKNCCAYLARKFCELDDIVEDAAAALSKHSVCICDDDNDLEMALACRHAYVPCVSSQSMADAVRDNPGRITVTSEPHGGGATRSEGTGATERALRLIMRTIVEA